MGSYSSGKSTQKAVTNPTFTAPGAATALSSALSRLSGPSSEARAVLDYFKSNLTGGTDITNPHLERVIRSQRPAFERNLDSSLAKIRSSGARGGRGRSELNQGQFIADAESGFSSSIAQLFADQFNRDQATQNELASRAAAGLLGYDAQQAALGQQLLSLLRGSISRGSGSSSGFTLDSGKMLDFAKSIAGGVSGGMKGFAGS